MGRCELRRLLRNPRDLALSSCVLVPAVLFRLTGNAQRPVKEDAAPRRRIESVPGSVDAGAAPDGDDKVPVKEAAAEDRSAAPAEAGGGDDPDASAKVSRRSRREPSAPLPP